MFKLQYAGSITATGLTLYFLNLGYPSYAAVNAVSNKANSESRPSRNSIKKNSTAHNHDSGSWESASGYATKANPCPPSATCSTLTPSFSAIKPSTLKTTQDAITEVRKSSVDTKLASM